MNFMQIWYESNIFSPYFSFSYQIWKKSISFLPYYCLWKYSGFNMKKKNHSTLFNKLREAYNEFGPYFL